MKTKFDDYFLPLVILTAVILFMLYTSNRTDNQFDKLYNEQITNHQPQISEVKK